MREDVAARLASLRKEFETGERRLEELDRQRAQLTETMLRISGAIQVLEELLAQGATTPDGAAIPAGGS
jgi:hypothetical protein